MANLRRAPGAARSSEGPRGSARLKTKCSIPWFVHVPLMPSLLGLCIQSPIVSRALRSAVRDGRLHPLLALLLCSSFSPAASGILERLATKLQLQRRVFAPHLQWLLTRPHLSYSRSLGSSIQAVAPAKRGAGKLGTQYLETPKGLLNSDCISESFAPLISIEYHRPTD